MKITNKFDAPIEFVRAVEDDKYDRGDADISVTSLIQPPQIGKLYEKHDDELSTDVDDKMVMWLGTVVHNALELYADGVAEERLYAEYNGLRISGAIDLVKEGGHVTDYKFSKTGAVQYGLKAEWEAQMNLYAWLLRQNDREVQSLQIVVVCKDHNKMYVGKRKNYPASIINCLPVPLWPENRLERYLAERVEIHTAEDDVECTEEERWWNGRNQEYMRCEHYCGVADFCTQFQGGV